MTSFYRLQVDIFNNSIIRFHRFYPFSFSYLFLLSYLLSLFFSFFSLLFLSSICNIENVIFKIYTSPPPLFLSLFLSVKNGLFLLKKLENIPYSVNLPLCPSREEDERNSQMNRRLNKRWIVRHRWVARGKKALGRMSILIKVKLSQSLVEITIECIAAGSKRERERETLQGPRGIKERVKRMKKK